jgi:cysteine-rich repeat protein
VVAECDQAADGTPCGERGRGTHCLFSACVRNVCGDGIPAEDEECDDGNERNGDSCSERCLLEGCGNGALDLGEECDDGNNASADGCGARCRIERCGNRVIDPGEECDDGNAHDDDICSSKCKTQILKMTDASAAGPDAPPNPGSDGGASQMDAGSNMDAGAATDSSNAVDTGGPVPDAGGPVTLDAGPADLADHRSQACKTCMEESTSPCRDFQASGTDLIAGCMRQDDATWTKKCSDAVFCSLNSPDLCAGDLTRGAVTCYCGLGRTIDDCFKPPSATTGPIGACISQWEQAANCAAGDLACVKNDFTVLTKPTGWANFLVSCAANDCAKDCWSGDAGLSRDSDAGAPGDGGAGTTGDN